MRLFGRRHAFDLHCRGDELREARERCGRDLASVAMELRVPVRDLRALEWNRPDLLKSERYAKRLLDDYRGWLGPDNRPRLIAPNQR